MAFSLTMAKTPLIRTWPSLHLHDKFTFSMDFVVKRWL